MSDTFVSEVTRSIRRSLFSRFKGLGISQSELTNLVAGSTKAALERAQVADLAAVAAAAGPVVAALTAAAPTDPALADFAAVTAGVSTDVQDLLAP